MSSDELSKAQDNFFKALEIMRGESKTNLVIFVSPLVALMSQLRFILTIESIIISVFLTISILSLLLGSCIAMYSASFARHWHAKEILFRSKNAYLGTKYINHLEKSYNQIGITLDEDGIIKLSDKLMKPMLILLLFGWLPLVAALIFVVWK